MSASSDAEPAVRGVDRPLVPPPVRRLHDQVADAAELLAQLGGVDLAQELSTSQARDVVELTDELLRSTRHALQKRIEEAHREQARADVDAERLARLEQHYARLTEEVGVLDAERKNLSSRLGKAEASAFAPLPVVGLLRRAVRVAVAALVGGVVAGPLAGPVVTFVLHDPILGKAFEGFLGALAGAIVSEANDAGDRHAENCRRAAERRDDPR